MVQLASARGRLTLLLAVLLLAVAGLALAFVHLQAQSTAAATWGSGTIVVLADPTLGGIQLLSAAPPIDDGPLAAIARDGVLLLVAWIALIPLVAWLAWSVAGRLSAPSRTLVEAASAAGPDNVTVRVPVAGVMPQDRRLGGAFNDLMARFERHAADRRRLVDDAAHEIRNPLAAMRTTIEVALAQPSDPDGLLTAALVSQRSGERIAATVDALQAEFHAGSGQTRRTRVDLAAMVGDVGRDFATLAAERHATLHVMAGPGLVLTADPFAIREALENLVVNALRYAPPGSPVIVAAGAVPGWRWVGVRDYGIGIAAHDQPLVFARGWHGTDGGHGSGIGLALVRQIAEAHGGTVRLSSAPHAGSSFVVWLPVQESPDIAPIAIDATTDPLWWIVPRVADASPAHPADFARQPASLRA
jgi:signal transduction histidine kinase